MGPHAGADPLPRRLADSSRPELRRVLSLLPPLRPRSRPPPHQAPQPDSGLPGGPAGPAHRLPVASRRGESPDRGPCFRLLLRVPLGTELLRGVLCPLPAPSRGGPPLRLLRSFRSPLLPGGPPGIRRRALQAGGGLRRGGNLAGLHDLPSGVAAEKEGRLPPLRRGISGGSSGGRRGLVVPGNSHGIDPGDADPTLHGIHPERARRGFLAGGIPPPAIHAPPGAAFPCGRPVLRPDPDDPGGTGSPATLSERPSGFRRGSGRPP
jgi:hypothetical protein